MKHWRYKGFKVVTFLDDGILSDRSEIDTYEVGQNIKLDLITSGFVPKIENLYGSLSRLLNGWGLIWILVR